MKVEKQTLNLRGHQLNRLILHPETPPRGALIFFHGQGDFIDRYPPVLEPFVNFGWQCFLTDLPGHGHSSGRRGHVPGFEFIDAMIDQLPTTQNMIIAGHSMGGMLALRELLRRPHLYHSGWFSSPLLSPSQRVTPIMRLLLRWLAELAPWITWKTGVKATDCRIEDHNGEPPFRGLYHGSISLDWAAQLINAASELKEQWLKLPSDRPLLFTQGNADSVCPASTLTARLAKMNAPEIMYHEINNGLHEPFTGDTAEQLQQILHATIKQLSE